MKQILTLEIDSELLHDCSEIAEDTGLDLESAIKMFLKRLSKEKSLAFILSSQKQSAAPHTEQDEFVATPAKKATNQNSNVSDASSSMTKSLATRLLRQNGLTLFSFRTFASKNKTAYNYWANPSIDCLGENWSLILNDWPNSTLLLFNIPANSISFLECRNDKPDVIDLQIIYDDPEFTDSRSGVRFAPYLTTKIKY